MNKGILRILCCPICKNQLKIDIEKEDNINIIDAKLYCLKCEKIYIIKDSIPHIMSQDVMTLKKKDYIPLKEPLDIYKR